MELYLYADVLFLVNFTMDFLTFFITASLLRRKARTLRLCFASVIGAVYGIAACFMGGTVLFQILINIAVSVLMCYVVFEKRILSAVAVFYCSGCLLGGIMTALYSFSEGTSLVSSVLDQGGKTAFGEIPLGWTAVVAGAAALAALAGGRIIKRRSDAFDVSVTVVTSEGSFIFDGICDSGNLLCDPISAYPVIILERSAFLQTVCGSDRAFFDSGSAVSGQTKTPLRIIPADTVGGHSILYGYLPVGVSVNGEEKSAVIAMGSVGFDGRSALVPSVLCIKQKQRKKEKQ